MVLLAGFVQNSRSHSYEVPTEVFFHAFHLRLNGASMLEYEHSHSLEEFLFDFIRVIRLHTHTHTHIYIYIYIYIYYNTILY